MQHHKDDEIAYTIQALDQKIHERLLTINHISHQKVGIIQRMRKIRKQFAAQTSDVQLLRQHTYDKEHAERQAIISILQEKEDQLKEEIDELEEVKQHLFFTLQRPRR